MPQIVEAEYSSSPKAIKFLEKTVTKIDKRKLLDITLYENDQGKKGEIIHNAKYVIGANNLAEGYCLLNSMRIEDFMNHPFVTSIQQLSENHQYLSYQIVIPSSNQVNLRFYEKNHQDYVERYGIISFYSPPDQRTIYLLVLDAYYPKTFESVLAHDIANFINQDLKYYALIASMDSN